MPNLFCDCDDTLVLYCVSDELTGRECKHEVHTYGDFAGDLDGCPNVRLINEIKKWREDNPLADLIIWSGGGSWYARRFAERFFPEETKVICLDKLGKNFNLPNADDIVIDDQDIRSAATVQDPRIWVYD